MGCRVRLLDRVGGTFGGWFEPGVDGMSGVCALVGGDLRVGDVNLGVDGSTCECLQWFFMELLTWHTHFYSISDCFWLWDDSFIGFSCIKDRL
jgi:hypothetical protein